MQIVGRLESIQVGTPRTYDVGSPQEWTTGFFKQPVAGPVEVETESLQGDGQADRRHHGGPDKAVLAYVADHYSSWQSELGDTTIPFGGFGENLSVTGLDEDSVCLGDVWKLGDVVLQVSQPRQPCWKLGRRWHYPRLPKQVVQTGRTGWYLRVLRTGTIAGRIDIELEQRPRPAWTIRRCNDVFYNGSLEEKQRLAAVPELAHAWRDQLGT